MFNQFSVVWSLLYTWAVSLSSDGALTNAEHDEDDEIESLESVSINSAGSTLAIRLDAMSVSESGKHGNLDDACSLAACDLVLGGLLSLGFRLDSL